MAPTSGGTTNSVAEVPNPPLLIPPPPFSWAAVVSGQVAGAPISPRSFSKSFHDVLEQNGPIKQKITGTFRGEPAVFFSKEEITKLATPFRYTVIGKFCYHRPSMEIIRKFFTSLGLKSLQSVGLLQQNHIAIFTSQKEDYTRLLMRATWYISGAPMKVLKWSPEFYPNIESPVVPVWVGLPGLPLHFFEKSALFCIASVLGNPLKIDEPTAKLSRPTVARVCIEVDVSKPRNRRIWLGDEKDGYWQEVIFENPPQYCGFCKVLGHDVSTCYKKNPELLKEKKKESGVEKINTEKNKRSDLPVVMVETDKQKEMWRRKEADAETDKPKDADGWVVVGEKKKNKIHSNTSKEETEKAMVAGKIKCTHSEISAKIPEEVQLPEESGEKTEGARAKQTTTFPGPPVLMVKSKMVAKSLISKNFPTGTKEKEGTVTEERIIQKNFASEFPRKEVSGVVFPAISLYGFKPSETLQTSVTLTPFPDFAKIRKKMGVGNEGNSGPFCLQDRNIPDPLSKAQTLAQNPPSNSNPIKITPLDPSTGNSASAEALEKSEQEVAGLQKGVREIQAKSIDQRSSKGPDLSRFFDQSNGANITGQLGFSSALDADKVLSAAHDSTTDKASDGKALVAENKVQPLDCSIEFQPPVHYELNSGPKVGASEVGCHLGPINSSGSIIFKGRGNLGFEFFKGSSPADLQSDGLNHIHGLGQRADSVGGNGKDQPGPSAAGPELLIPGEMGLGSCQLNKNARPPSTQSNFQSKTPSEDITSDEENNSAEDSDYFDTYHSDGDFPEDSDWFSDDSESAKLLKGKWRRGYTLRANISRRSLG